MCALLLLAHRAGTEFIIENPADRGDVAKPKLFINAEHGPLWLLPVTCALARQTSAKMVTFAMWAFGAPWQKSTTLMYTAGLDAWLDVLVDRGCEHSSHEKVAGGEKSNKGTLELERDGGLPPGFQQLSRSSRCRLGPTAPCRASDRSRRD